MEYELSKRLIEIAETDKKVNRRLNTAMFLSLRPQINQAIKDGWSIKFIWEALHKDKKIHIGYRMFLRMVKQHANASSDIDNQLINSNESEDIKKNSKKDQEPDQTKDQKDTTPKYPSTGNPKGFEWSTDYDVNDFI